MTGPEYVDMGLADDTNQQENKGYNAAEVISDRHEITHYQYVSSLAGTGGGPCLKGTSLLNLVFAQFTMYSQSRMASLFKPNSMKKRNAAEG